MKALIKSMIPAAWTPTVRKRYRWVADRMPVFRRGCPAVVAPATLRCDVAYNRYGAYCVPRSSSHRAAARAILAGRVREPNTIEFMRSRCGRGDIIHAGTYFGDFLPALSDALAPGALVWAFEPNRENYRCARITLELNEAANVRLTHAGLGAQRSCLLVEITDSSGIALGGLSRIVQTQGATRCEPVDVLTIDEAVPAGRDVGILQLDVEGLEKEALQGGLNTIRRCLPLLILESRPGSNLPQDAWFADSVLSLGYQQVGRLHGNLVFRSVRQHDQLPSPRIADAYS